MTEIRPFGSWLRAATGLLALAAVLSLGACGGGSGAPNNPYVDGGLTKPLVVLPNAAVDLYAGVPTVLTISGGKPPYTAASSNSALVPVATAVSGSTIVLVPNNATADTPVTVTVRDANGSTAISELVVHPSTMFSGMTVTPSGSDCGENAICSGQDGVASVKLQSATGTPLAGHAVRFDVVSGAFGIVSTGPGAPVVTSFTVVSDSLGEASVVIRASVNAPTQRAQLRATDTSVGQQVTGNFLIQQVTDGTKVLSVVPPSVTITGPDKETCSSGARVDYFIYGGTPPYRITAAFPYAQTLLNSVVTTNGGYFEVITNGTCSDAGLLYSILDASGRQTTATLINKFGTLDPVVIPDPIAVTPSAPVCRSGTAQFAITGGSLIYTVGVASLPNASSPLPTIDPQSGVKVGETVTVTGLVTGTTTLTVSDVAGRTASVRIACN